MVKSTLLLCIDNPSIITTFEHCINITNYEIQIKYSINMNHGVNQNNFIENAFSTEIP